MLAPPSPVGFFVLPVSRCLDASAADIAVYLFYLEARKFFKFYQRETTVHAVGRLHEGSEPLCYFLSFFFF